jgi:hypothetical protein
VPSGPRLFGITATHAPVVAVLRRGPSDWSHLVAWNIERGEFTSGAWIAIRSEADVAGLTPAPSPPPPEAERW